MTGFTPFYDIVGADIPNVPLVKGALVAYYNTGTGIVPASAAQIAAAKAAGMGVVLIDQWPGGATFAAGTSDILDVESGAATVQDAINGVKARQAHGWQSTIYISYGALAALDDALRSAGCDMSLVFYGVADYSWSQAQSETLLNQNPQWAYCQYGDPVSNPDTLIPGTNVTLSKANADIDVAKSSWAEQFMPDQPTPGPAPATTSFTATNTFASKGYQTGTVSWTAVPGATYQGEVYDVATKALVLQFSVADASVTGISLTWETKYSVRVRCHPTDAHPNPPWGQTAYCTTPAA